MNNAPLKLAMQKSATPKPQSRFAGFIRATLTAGLDVLLPPRCVACAEELAADNGLCGLCWQGLDLIDGPLCYHTGVPLPFSLGDAAADTVSLGAMMRPPRYDRARAAVYYQNTARGLVNRLKFYDMPEVANFLVPLMQRAGADILADASAKTTVILPVPLHFTRLLHRRYNQSAELARRLAALTDLPYEPRLLKRGRRTSQQIGLTRAKRRDNLRGAFFVTEKGKNAIAGKQVLLIDDVMTTGATVEACAKALRRAGAAKIDVLTFARVVMPQRVHI